MIADSGYRHGWPQTILAARFSIYRVGGKVNAVAPEADAFVHRTYKWMVTTDIDWSSAGDRQHIAENLEWQRDVFNTFFVMLGRLGSSQNFPDPSWTTSAMAFWGINFPRLLPIKGR